ncbi:MAG: hypothetical protein ACRD5Z_04240, partial [Bryobacteraceae bacterium]
SRRTFVMMGWISEEFPATTRAINEQTLGRIVAALKGAFVFIFGTPMLPVWDRSLRIQAMIPTAPSRRALRHPGRVRKEIGLRT